MALDKIEETAAGLTQHEFRIIARYANGESAANIAANTGIDAYSVQLTIESVAKSNPGLARNIAAAWGRRHAAKAGTGQSPAAGSVPSAGVEEMLAEAGRSGDSRLVRAADKINMLVGELRGQLADHQRKSELREEQRALQERLDKVSEELRRGSRSAAPASSAAAGVDSKAIRSWAAANGVDCPALGRVPARVREAYELAMSQPSGGS